MSPAELQGKLKQALSDEKYRDILPSVKPVAEVDLEKELPIQSRGVPVGLLLVLTDVFNLQALKTSEVVEQVIKPITDNKQCRFVDLKEIRPYVSDIHCFISHAWDGNWIDLVSSIADGARNDKMVWLDIFSVLQHPQTKQKEDLELLDQVIRFAPQGTLLSFNPDKADGEGKANPIKRSWCLYEIYKTVSYEAPLLIKTGFRVDDAGSTLQLGKFQRVNDADRITKLVYATDINKATATVAKDQKRILKEIKTTIGTDQLNTNVRTSLYNAWRILSRNDLVQDVLFNNLEAIQGQSLVDEGTGETLLHDLVSGGFAQCVQHVLDNGLVDVDAQTLKGNTAMHFAAEGGRGKICDILIKSNADLKLVNLKKETALHLAAKYGRMKAVKLLLAAGADTSAQDNGGYTPLALAKLDKLPGCEGVVRLFEMAGKSGDVVRKPGDWECPKCQALNFSKQAVCYSCSAKAVTAAPKSGRCCVT